MIPNPHKERNPVKSTTQKPAPTATIAAMAGVRSPMAQPAIDTGTHCTSPRCTSCRKAGAR